MQEEIELRNSQDYGMNSQNESLILQVQQQSQQLLKPNVVIAKSIKQKSSIRYKDFLKKIQKLKEANGRNMTKFIIKDFFSSIKEHQFEKDHQLKLMKVWEEASDTGNITHLQELFGTKQDLREEQMSKKNREIAQEKIAHDILKDVMMNNSIKDPVNYICTCYCYMYRLNFPEVAASGVALLRKQKKQKEQSKNKDKIDE